MLSIFLMAALVIEFIFHFRVLRILQKEKAFNATVSHELKTPLTVIRGYAETLPSSEVSEKILRSCDRMERVMKSVLKISSLEAEPSFQSCGINTILEHCLHLISSSFPSAFIEIEKPAEPVVADVDSDLLEIALLNILENGIKYSPTPAHLKICLQEQFGTFIIKIQDQGMGIPKKDLPHIFERFYTVSKNQSRRLGGAGLGLYLVKSIVEKHEGTVSVQSTLGQGTTFTLVLPQHQKIQEVAGWDESAIGTHR